MSQKVNQIIQQKAYLHSKDKEHNPEKQTHKNQKTKKQKQTTNKQTPPPHKTKQNTTWI